MSDSNQEDGVKKDKGNTIEICLIILLILFVILIWLLFPWILTYLTNSFDLNIKAKDDPNFGTFGDTFGALNTLFSGLAFATLIITLFLQRKELQEQRKELTAQREEITKANEIAESQRNITKQQSELLAQQSFYSLLFKLLDEKNNKINLFYFKDSHNGRSYERHECFIFYSKNILRSADNLNIHIREDMTPSDELDAYRSFIQSFYHDASVRSDNLFEATLYFELITNILDLIDKQSNHKNIETDIAFFKSYISHDELVVIATYGFYNSKLYRYINKYGLLANFDSVLYETPYQIFSHLYDTNAFRTFIQNEAA